MQRSAACLMATRCGESHASCTIFQMRPPGNAVPPYMLLPQQAAEPFVITPHACVEVTETCSRGCVSERRSAITIDHSTCRAPVAANGCRVCAQVWVSAPTYQFTLHCDATARTIACRHLYARAYVRTIDMDCLGAGSVAHQLPGESSRY